MCVLHTHTVAGVAVSCQKQGLLPLNQWSLQFTDRLAYHDYEGIALDLDERARLVADLGDKFVIILRNDACEVRRGNSPCNGRCDHSRPPCPIDRERGY
jgi:hypothetical protein